MSKKTRLFLIIPVLAAAAGFTTQAVANEPIDEGGGEGYVGTLYQEVGGGGYLCDCGGSNCKPCM